MPLITLITDFGNKDHFVGALKGKIYSLFSDVTLVDISHEIDLFNVFEAGYITLNSSKYFPDYTIHIIDVDAELKPDLTYVVMQWNNQYFITANNGILNFLTETKKAQNIIEISLEKSLKFATEMDVFAFAATHIAKGNNINELGKQIENLIPFYNLQIIKSENQIKGNVVYVDHFGNCVTNIDKATFEEIGKNRSFKIYFKNKSLNRINKSYNDFKISEQKPLKEFEGDFLALFNEANFLEIAIYKSNPNTIGSPSSLIGLSFRDFVSIEFE